MLTAYERNEKYEPKDIHHYNADEVREEFEKEYERLEKNYMGLGVLIRIMKFMWHKIADINNAVVEIKYHLQAGTKLKPVTTTSKKLNFSKEDEQPN